MRTQRILKYVALRAAQAIPTILLIVVLNFFLLHLAPGDAAEVLAGEAGAATPEYLARLKERFGLDQSLAQQFIGYALNIVSFDLGYSFRQNMSVLDLILSRLGPTLLLMGTTFAISIGLGVLLGIIAARRVGSWADRFISIFAVLAYATPLFWIGLMLILVFAIKLNVLPTSGMETVASFHEGWDRVGDIAVHLVLPVATLSMFYLAVYLRLMRASILEQAKMDYVVTAEAKGITQRRIVLGHILRNALLPVVTMAGVQVGSLLGGSVIVESVFGWPGLGLLAYEALFARDINLLLGIFFVSGLLVICINLLVDVLYAILDPRIKLG